MSKQSEAKKNQNYREKPNTCSNCIHYKSDIVEVAPSWTNEIWEEEKNKRCSIGGFVVKKMALCDLHNINGE